MEVSQVRTISSVLFYHLTGNVVPTLLPRIVQCDGDVAKFLNRYAVELWHLRAFQMNSVRNLNNSIRGMHISAYVWIRPHSGVASDGEQALE